MGRLNFSRYEKALEPDWSECCDECDQEVDECECGVEDDEPREDYDPLNFDAQQAYEGWLDSLKDK